MSVTRAEDRPDRSHVPPTPPAKLAPADDPAWAATFMLADAAREARPTTTNEETTTMPIDQSAYVFGEPIPYDHVTAVEALAWLQDNAPTHTQRSDEWTRWSVGARYLASAVAELADERLTISVGRDTAKEARDALAWFQLGQSAPVTIDVEEDCLWVYLDECSISIGVTAETGDEIYVRTSVRQYDVGAYLTEQTQFDAAPLDDEDHDAIVDTVTELMQNLTGFHYLAGGAAVRAIHAEGRP